MPAVNTVLVVGGGLAGAATAILLADGGRRGRPRRDQAGRRRHRIRHHLAGQRPARAARARRLGRGRAAGLRLRQPRAARPRPARHPARRDPRRPHRRPGPARRDGHAASRPGADPARPRGRGRRQDPLRHHRHRAGPGRRRRRRHLLRRLDRPLRPRRRRRRHPLVDPPRMLGIELETRSHRHGDLARVRPAPGRRSTRTDLFYGGPCYIAGLLPDRRELALRLHRRGRPGPQRADPGRAARRRCASWPRPTTGRGTRSAATLDRPGPGQLHLVRDPCAADAPWNRGRVVLIGDAAHACPPTLAQGGAQALEDAAVLAELLLDRDALDERPVGRFHARRVRPRARPSSRRPTSSPSGCSTTSRATCPA